MTARGLATWLVLAACTGAAATACADHPAPRTAPALQCGALAEGERHALVDFARFEVATPADDPWAEFRPGDDITCAASARGPEAFGDLPAYSVITAACPYTTVVQPTREDSCRGESVFIWIWRFALTGPEGASAHIAVQIGDEPVWELEVPIPAPSALIVENIPLVHDHPAGTPIYFHVRNHGANSYQLLGLGRCHGECRAE